MKEKGQFLKDFSMQICLFFPFQLCPLTTECMLCSRIAERRFVDRQIKPQAGEKATQTHGTGYRAYTCVMVSVVQLSRITRYLFNKINRSLPMNTTK